MRCPRGFGPMGSNTNHRNTAGPVPYNYQRQMQSLTLSQYVHILRSLCVAVLNFKMIRQCPLYRIRSKAVQPIRNEKSISWIRMKIGNWELAFWEFKFPRSKLNWLHSQFWSNPFSNHSTWTELISYGGHSNHEIKFKIAGLLLEIQA